MGKSLDRYLSPTGVEVWRNVKCQKKWGGGAFDLLNLNSLVRGGNSSKIKKKIKQTFWFFWNQSDPKILHCAIECVTLCWSASEGLSPQLGKEASLLPSNTIHTLLTLPPTRPQSSSALPSWHPLSSYHIAPWVTMSGVTINACLLLALKNTTDWVSLLCASSGGWGSETPLMQPPPKGLVPSRNDHTCRGSHSWGWQGTVHKHSYLWFGSVRFNLW